jgi:hypothetical protein
MLRIIYVEAHIRGEFLYGIVCSILEHLILLGKVCVLFGTPFCVTVGRLRKKREFTN